MELLIQRRLRAGGRWQRALWFALLVLSPFGSSLAQVANEYEVKAAFLFKFASFVEWPPQSGNASPCIAIVGQDPFGSALDEIVAGKFVVRRFRSGQEPADCRIVFVSVSEKKHVGVLLDHLRNSAVLTVSDMPGFCERGGMINLALADNHVAIEINPDAAGQARLQVSSKLLNVARIIHPARSSEGFRP